MELLWRQGVLSTKQVGISHDSPMAQVTLRCADFVNAVKIGNSQPHAREYYRFMEKIHRELFGPGPTNVPDSVLEALSRPTIGHLDPEFLKLMDRVGESLKYSFQTTSPLTFVLSGQGSVGMEASFVNLVEPGDKVVVCSNGVFGGRMRDICERIGAEVISLESEWGTEVRADALKQTLEEHGDVAVVAFVHS